MFLIVGLGNPGKTYQKTRHNVGFMILDHLHKKMATNGISDWSLSKKFNAEIAGFSAHGQQFLLAKPATFMNASGEAVQLIAHFYKLTPNDILIVHDDKDISLGEFKVQSGRGDAGHNGVKSIFEHAGTKDITRIRVGVASDNAKKMRDTPSFVLGNFGFFERKKLTETLERVTDEIEKTFIH